MIFNNYLGHTGRLIFGLVYSDKMNFQHVEANHRIVKKFTESQETFTEMQQKYEDEKMREYKDKGIFNENMELIPKKPKTPEEMELEALETAAPKFVVDAYKWAKGQT